MASRFRAPGLTGPSITGFMEGMMASAQRRQLTDQNTRANQLHDVQMANQRQQMADTALARQAIPTVLAGPPETATVVPAQPGGFQSIATHFTPDMDPEAAAFAGQPAHQATPGAPAVTESAHTMRSIAANAGGPANVAALLRTAEGRQAVDALKPITDAEFQVRQRRRRGREDYERLMREASSARAGGDELRAVDTEASAYRALAQALDDPGPALRTVRELMKERTDLYKDKDDRERAQQEMPRVAQAMAAYHEDPKPDTYAAFLEAATSVTSTHAKKRADILLQQVEKDAVQQMRAHKLTQHVAKVHTAVGQAISQQRERGEPMNLAKAYKEALASDPEAANEFLTQIMTGDRAVPKPVLDAIFGTQEVPDTIAKEADAIVATRPGMVRGTGPYYVALSEQITAITRARQKPSASLDDDARSTTQILQYRGQLSRELNSVNTRLAALISPRDPERPALEGRARAIEAEMAATSETLRQRGVAPTVVAPTPPPPVNPAALSTDQRAAIRTVIFAVLKERHGEKKGVSPAEHLQQLSPEEQQAILTEVQRRVQAGPSGAR